MKRQLHALRLQERKNADKATCKALGTIVLDGNKIEDRSGAQGLPPSYTSVRAELAKAFAKAEKQRAPRPPIQILMARLKRLEERIGNIQDLANEYIDKYGGEPSTMTLIKQWADGDYDR